MNYKPVLTAKTPWASSTEEKRELLKVDHVGIHESLVLNNARVFLIKIGSHNSEICGKSCFNVGDRISLYYVSVRHYSVEQ
jgi:hypothetical protein